MCGLLSLSSLFPDKGLNRSCIPVLVVHLDNRPANTDVFRGYLELCRSKRSHGFGHRRNFSSEDAVIRSGHTDVALKCGSIRKNTSVCCGDVGVRAKDCCYASVKLATQELFIAGRFIEKVNQKHSYVSVDPL